MNSFLHPVDEVRFGTYRPEDVPEALEITRAQADERYAAVRALAPTERTFANTVLGFTRASVEFDAVVRLVSHHSSVLPGWSDADAQVTKASAELSNEIAFSTELYSALRDLRDSGAELAFNERHLLTEILESYERNGVSSPPEVQDKLRVVRSRLSELQTEFKTNLVAAARESGLALPEAEQLAGMPAAFVERAREAAAERGQPGYWVAYSQPNYLEVVTNCTVAGTRQAMYDIQITLGGSTNAVVAEEILRLRQRQAELLGYADFADLIAESRMAKSGQRVEAFLADLVERYRPLAAREHAELLEFARRYESDPELELGPVDVDSGLNLYYADKLFAEQVGFDPRSLRDYLPLPQVVEETFRILDVLYGVRFTEVELPAWHSNVSTYAVHDEGGRHLATLYADWSARPDKRSGAWKSNFYVPPRGAADNGKPYLGPVVFNFPAAEAGEPVLLTPRDAQTVLHEIGHHIHEVLSRTELTEQAGTSVRRDFVEAPSQIMENWFWEPEVLARMARHWRTGEPLPEASVQALRDARNFRVATAAMRQLFFATLDLRVHRGYAGGDVLAYARALKDEFLPVLVAPYDQFPASFSHIFEGGYAAGYYSYKWAEVIEADLYSRFAAEGPLSPEVGRAYRDTVLSRGSEVEPDVAVQDFLGRPASPDAMLRRDGLEVALPT